MVDKCSCKHECSSSKQGLEHVTKNSFPKKLLVATSVVVILAMSLRSTEAASIEHRRHRLHDMTRLTKDAARPVPHTQHKKRHQGQMRNGTLTTKEPGNKRRISYELYENERKKIEKLVSLTLHNFKDRREMLTESAAYGTGMLDWLPKTNFVDIHVTNSHISKNQQLSDAAKRKRKFVFLIKKLYKSLLGYQEVFKTFLQVQPISPDTQITDYTSRRQIIFTATYHDLCSATGGIKDAMSAVKMPKPNSKKLIQAYQTKLKPVEKNVNGALYLKNDNILLKAYGNLLDNWFLELNCSGFFGAKKLVDVNMDVNKEINVATCKNYERSIEKKRRKRRNNNKHKKTL